MLLANIEVCVCVSGGIRREGLTTLIMSSERDMTCT